MNCITLKGNDLFIGHGQTSHWWAKARVLIVNFIPSLKGGAIHEGRGDTNLNGVEI